MKDIEAALVYLRAQGTNKRGVIGYCFGGTIAWLAATRLNPNAAVGYYGGQIIRYSEDKPRCPVMLHFGILDKNIPKRDVDRLQEAHPEVQIFSYQADHGFNCSDRASYSAAAAKLARVRSLEFLKKHLATK
jgi:carboxymethylenebutenolidase